MFDWVEFPKPIEAGRGKGHRGFVHIRLEMWRGTERVMTFESPIIIGRRPL